MFRLTLILGISLTFGPITAQDLQLAPPQTPSTRLLATNSTTISFDFRLQGAEIRFTTDGSEPTTTSGIYTNPLNTSNLTTIKAKSFKAGFLPSETTTVLIIPGETVRIDSVSATPPPKKYLANGWKTLCDQRLGDENIQQNWLGFDAPEVVLEVFPISKKKLSKINLGFLRQQRAWIFLPVAIEVYDEKGRLLATKTLPAEATALPANQEFISIALPKHRYKSLKIKLMALATLPTWHPGHGNTGWIFLDEIMLW